MLLPSQLPDLTPPLPLLPTLPPKRSFRVTPDLLNSTLERAQTQRALVSLVTDLSVSPSLSHLSPEAADSSSFDVQLGDIILTASDGLFDNMPDYMILQELKKLKVTLGDRKSQTYILHVCKFESSRSHIKLISRSSFFIPYSSGALF